MNIIKPDLELKQLSNYSGSQRYHRLSPRFVVTDGIKYLMDNGYSWFVTDALAVIAIHPRLRMQDFYVVELKLTKSNKAEMIIDDGNNNVLYTQEYGYTDAKRDLKFYVRENLVMLPTEY